MKPFHYERRPISQNQYSTSNTRRPTWNSPDDLLLRWQWIKMMENRAGQTIYVPTEANLPILEASRRPDEKKGTTPDHANEA